MPLNEIQKRRKLQQLGRQAVDYYIDTGFCVFCDADDCRGIPHDDFCEVGVVAEVPLTPERITTKAQQRATVDTMLRTLQGEKG